MDPLTAQLATLPASQIEAMIEATRFYVPQRLRVAYEVAARREAALRGERDFPALRWVTL